MIGLFICVNSAGVLQSLHSDEAAYEMGLQKQHSSYFKQGRVHLHFVFGQLECKLHRLLLLAHFMNTCTNVGYNLIC